MCVISYILTKHTNICIYTLLRVHGMFYCIVIGSNVPRNNDNDGHNYDLFVRMIIIISNNINI